MTAGGGLIQLQSYKKLNKILYRIIECDIYGQEIKIIGYKCRNCYRINNHKNIKYLKIKN